MAADIRALDALTLRDRLASGALRAVEVAEAYLARIVEREPEINAWAWHDPEFVLKQAKELDTLRGRGRGVGPLHGIPVGLKDVIDTARIPTENGCPVDQGRVPSHDAFVVEALRRAGAIIMGKTVTTELAFLYPGATKNPHAQDHT
ncbi:MAG: amidase family protein, partial [Pseudomonadota bacterium]